MPQELEAPASTSRPSLYDDTDDNGKGLEKDPEKGRVEAPASHKNAPSESKNPKVPNLVDWDGDNDPQFPKNWPKPLKWKYTWAVSLFVFISPVSSAMVAPALFSLGADLKMYTEVEVFLSVGIFILAYAVGPIFFGPASELYGRVQLLKLSNLWFIAWNLGCGFATNKEQFFAFRFLAGIGGSAPLAIGGGSIR